MSLTKKIEKNINNYKLNYLYNCITGCTILSKKKYLEKILPVPDNSRYLIHDHWIGLNGVFEWENCLYDRKLI